MAIEPETSTERKKLADVLEMMKRQDPTFRARENEETGQTLISGMGELHLEVIKHRLLRDFKLERARPQAAGQLPRDDRAGRSKSTGECHRNMGGQIALRPKVRIRMEPFRKGAKPVTSCRPRRGGVLPEPYPDRRRSRSSTEQGEGGGMLGFPLMHVKITVLGGEVHETDSNELAFRYAAADAFKKGLREAGIVLLEPIMRLRSHHARGTSGRHRRRLAAAAGDDHPHRTSAAATR